MRKVLATERGSELYRKRQPMIEPMFAQVKFNRGLDRFSAEDAPRPSGSISTCRRATASTCAAAPRHSRLCEALSHKSVATAPPNLATSGGAF